MALLLLLNAPPLPILILWYIPVWLPVPHARVGRSSGSRVSSFPRKLFFLRLMSLVLEIREVSSPMTVITGPKMGTAPALFSHCAGLGYLQRSLVSGFSALITFDVALARTIRTLHWQWHLCRLCAANFWFVISTPCGFMEHHVSIWCGCNVRPFMG